MSPPKGSMNPHGLKGSEVGGISVCLKAIVFCITSEKWRDSSGSRRNTGSWECPRNLQQIGTGY